MLVVILCVLNVLIFAYLPSLGVKDKRLEGYLPIESGVSLKITLSAILALNLKDL